MAAAPSVRTAHHRRTRALFAVGAAAVVLAPLASAAGPADAATEQPAPLSKPLPVTGPDTIPVAGGKGYITYGASMLASKEACGRAKQMSTKKSKKNCWIPYVTHGEGAEVGTDPTVDGDALPDGPGRWVDRDEGLWAPSVVHYRDRYYLFYTATQKNTSQSDERGRKCIGVAVSKSARGGFEPRKDPLVCHEGGWAIDAEAFVGVSERRPLYLTYRDDSAAEGYQTAIVTARLDENATRLVKRKRLLTSAAVTWEHHAKKGEHDTYIIENPSMIWVDRHWWLFYSGNRWQTEKYSTGIAKCGSNPIARECTPVPDKDRPYFGYFGEGGLQGEHEPVAHLPRNEKAPGGMSVFRARDNKLRAVWNYKTFPKDGESVRKSLVGRLHYDDGRWRVTEE